jgi:hypothetical protein
MRATLNTLEGVKRSVWVADSFQGFPHADGDLRDGYDLSLDLAGCDFLAVPLDEVSATFERLGCGDGIEFVPGFFQETLPGLAGRRWSVIRLDGDTYDSTLVAMQSLYPGLAAGGYVIVDDYLSLEECRAAVDDFRREHSITDSIEDVDWNSVRWRRRSASAVEAVVPPAPPAPPAPRPVTRRPRARVPTIEEVALGEQIEELRKRLADAEDEIAWFVSSPIRGPRRWLGNKLRRYGLR